MQKTDRYLVAFAVIALVYAVAGNYVALPGYLRFLDRGGTSAAGNSFDQAVLWGAAKTIAWMLAFNLAAVCLYLAAVRQHAPGYVRHALAISIVWVACWMVPELPRMHFSFYLVCGSLILALIVATANPRQSTVQSPGPVSRFYIATSLYFFAVATWDVCGLGSTGRILHPEQVVLERSQLLLSAQTTKLMIAFLLAWGAMAMAFRHQEASA